MSIETIGTEIVSDILYAERYAEHLQTALIGALEITAKLQVMNEEVVAFQSYLESFILRQKTYTFFFPDNLRQIADMCFSEELNRDITFSIASNFKARVCDMKLNDYVADLVTYIPVRTVSIIPEEIRDRLPTRKDVIELLDGNDWLIPLFLMGLFGFDFLQDIQRGSES